MIEFDKDKIKKAIKAKKMTQLEFAKSIGIPKSTFSQIMCGHIKNPRIDTVEAIYKALKFNNELELIVNETIIEKINLLNEEQKKSVETIIDHILKNKQQ